MEGVSVELILLRPNTSVVRHFLLYNFLRWLIMKVILVEENSVITNFPIKLSYRFQFHGWDDLRLIGVDNTLMTNFAIHLSHVKLSIINSFLNWTVVKFLFRCESKEFNNDVIAWSQFSPLVLLAPSHAATQYSRTHPTAYTSVKKKKNL